MQKLNFHVGLHKTGTTTVQQIYRDLSERDKENVYVRPESHEFSELKHLLLRGRGGASVDRGKLQAVAEEFFVKIKTTGQIFISDENILGATPLSPTTKNQRALYPNLERQVQVIDEVFRDFDLSFIVTVRSFPAFVRSIYLDGLRYLRYGLTFEEFIAFHDIESFHPGRIVERIRASTSRRVVIISIDAGISHSALTKSGLLPESIEEASINIGRANTSLSTAAASILRIFGGQNLEATEIDALRQWLKDCPVKIEHQNISFPDISPNASVTEALRRIQDLYKK